MTIRLTNGDDTYITMGLMRPELQDYLDHYFSLDFLRPFLENPYTYTKRGTDVIFPSYGPLPTPKINELVVPTGATRWSHIVLCCDTSAKNDIYNKAFQTQNRLILEFGAGRVWGGNAEIGDNTGNTQPIRLVMSPLQPHPVQIPEIDEEDIYNEQPAKGLWLVPMVDDRYFWQFADVLGMSDQEFSSPVDMVQWVFSSIPVVGKVRTFATGAVESVGSGYTGFLPVVADNNYENAAVMLDSICWHLGLQIVPDLEHMLTTNDPTDANDWMAVGPAMSEEIYDRNLNGQLLDMHTGGTPGVRAAGLPIRSFGGDLDYSGPKYLPQDIYIPTDNEFTDWIKKTELDDGQGFPTRSVRMRLKYDEPTTNDLANQIAYDYYARFFHSFNLTFAATQVWQPSLYDDYAVYSQKLKNIDGNLVASAMTRVRSLQGNILPVAVTQGTGGGVSSRSDTILFEIVRIERGVGLNCNAMEVEVLNVSCGTTIVSQGDLVTVYDEIGCVFNAPEHLLIGMRGYAIRMDNPDYPDTEILEFAEGTEDIAVPTGRCRWAVQTLCCVEESV